MADFDDDDTESDQPDPILRLVGPSLVARARAGEVGVFASIETHNQLLDAIAKARNQSELQPLKQIFDDTKVTKARSHKLDRLVSERIQAQERALSGGHVAETQPPQKVAPEPLKRPADKPSSSSSSSSAVDAPSKPPVVKAKPVSESTQEESVVVHHPKRKQDEVAAPVIEQPPVSAVPIPRDLVSLSPAEEYRLSDKLREMRATVRVRAQPSVDAQVLGQVTADSTVIATGMSSTWLRVRWPLNDGSHEDDDEHVTGWALRSTPDGHPLFAPVLYEDVETDLTTPAKPPQASKPAKLPVVSQEHAEEEEAESVQPTSHVDVISRIDDRPRAREEAPQHQPPAKQPQQPKQEMVSIPAEDFYLLMERVRRLEEDIAQLRQLLRSA